MTEDDDGTANLKPGEIKLLKQQLIDLVQVNEVIYDTKHELYKDNKHRDHIFSIIGSQCKPKISGPQAKKLWTNLRNNYTTTKNRINKTSSGQGAKSEKVPSIINQLSFLESKFVNKSISTKKISDDVITVNEEDMIVVNEEDMIDDLNIEISENGSFSSEFTFETQSTNDEENKLIKNIKQEDESKLNPVLNKSKSETLKRSINYKKIKSDSSSTSSSASCSKSNEKKIVLDALKKIVEPDDEKEVSLNGNDPVDAYLSDLRFMLKMHFEKKGSLEFMKLKMNLSKLIMDDLKD